MNLKEAFRYQNKLESILYEVQSVLMRDSNVTQVENTYLRKKVMAEAEDETVVEVPSTPYADRITDLTAFMMSIVAEKEKLFKAIRQAKNGLTVDIDSETSLNASRQKTAQVLRHMVDLRSSEVIQRQGGLGYRFNTDGNQVSYKCDVKRVTTINFDRNAIRRYLKELDTKADEMSSEIDKCIVNSQVAYEPPFDVNASFDDIVETYLSSLTK